MDKKKAFSPPVVGAASLLVIFAVLVLTVFALLSMATVQANDRLRLRTEAAVYDYYAADTAAHEILAQLRSGQMPADVAENNGVYSYHCPISDTQTLLVSVRLGGTDYTVLQWQAVSTAEWQANEDLIVWDGQE